MHIPKHVLPLLWLIQQQKCARMLDSLIRVSTRVDAGAARNAQAQPATRRDGPCRATATRWKTVCTHKEFRGAHTEGHKDPVWNAQVHNRNKSTTQTHEEPRRVHTRKRACECKCAADGPPTLSGVRTQANSLQESCLGTCGTARVQVLCQSHPSRCHQPFLIFLKKTEVWTIRHDVLNPPRGF